MENKVKRIGYLPRKRVLEIIDEISKSESISRSKVVGILVEEALDASGIALSKIARLAEKLHVRHIVDPSLRKRNYVIKMLVSRYGNQTAQIFIT